jgi:hypothetical protein
VTYNNDAPRAGVQAVTFTRDDTRDDAATLYHISNTTP